MVHLNQIDSSRASRGENNRGGDRPFRKLFFLRGSAAEEIAGTLKKIRGSEVVAAVSEGTKLYRYEVPIRNLPSEFDEFSILHLSDIHFRERFINRTREFFKFYKHLTEVEVKPDLVCITGDIVTSSSRDLGVRARAYLRLLGGDTPKIFVMGNHDYYGNTPNAVRKIMTEVGYSELFNQKFSIQRGEAKINLYGADDCLMGSPKAPSWENFPEDEVNILMAHNLDVLTARWPDLFNLVLTGHVHAGEFGIGKFINGSSFLKLIGDYKDLNQHLVGWNALTERCLSYVSPGFSRHFGNFGVKPPGGTLITLRSE